MKNRTHRPDRIISLAAAMTLAGILSTTPAFAWKAYHLEGNLWAIRCNDNTLWSYSGSEAGLDIVGPELCKGHGGLANPGGGVEVVPASAELKRFISENCGPADPRSGAAMCGKTGTVPKVLESTAGKGKTGTRAPRPSTTHQPLN